MCYALIKFIPTIFFHFKLHRDILCVLEKKSLVLAVLKAIEKSFLLRVKKNIIRIQNMTSSLTITLCPWSAKIVQLPINANSLSPKIFVIKPQEIKKKHCIHSDCEVIIMITSVSSPSVGLMFYWPIFTLHAFCARVYWSYMGNLHLTQNLLEYSIYSGCWIILCRIRESKMGVFAGHGKFFFVWSL